MESEIVGQTNVLKLFQKCTFNSEHELRMKLDHPLIHKNVNSASKNLRCCCTMKLEADLREC